VKLKRRFVCFMEVCRSVKDSGFWLASVSTENCNFGWALIVSKRSGVWIILLNMDAFLKRSNGGDGSICFGFQSCGLYGLQGIIQFLMAWQQIAVWFC
jgi:hypothetical protein